MYENMANDIIFKASPFVNIYSVYFQNQFKLFSYGNKETCLET